MTFKVALQHDATHQEELAGRGSWAHYFWVAAWSSKMELPVSSPQDVEERLAIRRGQGK